MARELRRLLISPERLAAVQPLLELTAAEAHYVRRVLRLRPGDRLELLDGHGALWSARLEAEAGTGIPAAAALRLEQPAAEPLRREARQPWPIRLALAVPRRDPEVVWRMATELGVDQLQPLLAERSSLRGSLPLERWGTIVAEAAEQCERLWLPELAAPAEALAWLANQQGGRRLLATTRRAGLPALEAVLTQEAALEQEAVLEQHKDHPSGEPAITLAIGPEGGWSPAEEQRAEAAGWQVVSLGEAILRSSTAAVAGVARLAAWRAQLPREPLSCAASTTPSP